MFQNILTIPGIPVMDVFTIQISVVLSFGDNARSQLPGDCCEFYELKRASM